MIIPDYVKSYVTEEEYNQVRFFFIEQIYKIDPNKKSILFSTPAHTGTSHFRLVEPMRAMFLKYPDKYNYVYTENFDISWISKFDLIVQHRAGDVHKRMLDIVNQTQHRKHIPIVHDVDDNEINVPKSNPLYNMWIEAGKHKMAEYQLTHSDIVTTTTPIIAKEFNKYNKHVSVFPNMFDWTLPQWNKDQEWLRKKNAEGYIVIGWAGLTSHMSDIEKMYKFLKNIYTKYPNTYFIFAGMPIKNSQTLIKIDPVTKKKVFEEQPVTEYEKTYKYKVEQIYKDFDRSRIEFLDVKSLGEYGEFYSKFNISICYTEDKKFNHNKSAIKSIESMRYGAITLCSHMGGYKVTHDEFPDDLKNYNLSIIQDSQFEWERKLSHVLDNYDSFKALAEKHKAWVSDKYEIANSVDRRIQFYDALMDGKSIEEIETI